MTTLPLQNDVGGRERERDVSGMNAPLARYRIMRQQLAAFFGVISSLSLTQQTGAQQIHSARGRRTSAWVHGDTSFIRAHPGTLLRFIQRGDTVWMMRQERGEGSPEIRWIICGDSAVAEAPRRVVSSEFLLLPRRQALQQMHADSILAKLHSP